MKLTPQQAAAREAYLRKLSIHHDEIIDEVNLVNYNIIEEIEKINNQLNTKLARLQEIKNVSDRIINEFLDFLRKSESKTNKVMRTNWEISVCRQQKLHEAFNKKMAAMEHLRTEHVKEEKALRRKKDNMEKEFILLLKQYDKNMLDKQSELDNIVESANPLNYFYKQLTRLSEKQDESYELLMKDKEEYKRMRLEELKRRFASRKILKRFRSMKRKVKRPSYPPADMKRPTVERALEAGGRSAT
ncbi:unnamed protein product [Nezara viridula]|uniref:Uncharacterized protein n=1 Tax=Nezara viridula TaxID=85310 RepID=A0A9P0MRM8_NEZVI|nr:unnamed protein product [Nezara viridula]